MALLAPWLAAREGGERPAASLVLTQACCQFGFNYALVYVSETLLPSGLVSVLWAVFPLMMALAAHFVTKTEHLRRWQWLGVMAGFAGVVVLFVTDVAALSARAVAMGLVLLLGPLAVTFSTLFVKLRGARTSSILLNRDSMLLGAALLLILSLLVEDPSRARFTPTAVGSIVYLALAGTVLTFGVYLWLLRSVPAYRLSLIAYVTPVVALWLGWAVGAEPLGVSTLVGTAFVVGGVALTLRRAI